MSCGLEFRSVVFAASRGAGAIRRGHTGAQGALPNLATPALGPKVAG
jgi:hypothetical protein